MKQLKTKLKALSPSGNDSLQAKSVTFKQVQIISSPFYSLIGKWRMYWNYCPECNSCAPQIHQCEVCNADTKSHFHWNENVQQNWWKKYAEKHRIAV